MPSLNLLVNVLLLFSARYALSAPALNSHPAVVPSSVASAELPITTVPFAKEDPNGILWTQDNKNMPEAIRGSLGADVIGPQNVPIDLQNADFLAPPSTDAGTV